MFQKLTGLQYLKADIACKFDKAFEKATWDRRLEKFSEIDLTDKNLYRHASNPIGLRAAIEALKEAEAGNPTGYMISLDACSSGLQILSLLVSCPKSFDLCGGRSDKCVDSYTQIYEDMHLHGSLTRKQVKNAIMTSLYGSTQIPEITFGDNIELFYETMEKMAPGAWELNLGLQDLWNDVVDHDYAWVLPDNFHAYVETQSSEKLGFEFFGQKFELKRKIPGRPQFHKGIGPNLIHSIDGLIVREMYRRCMFDPKQTTRLMALIMKEEGFGTDDEKAPMVQTLWSNYLKTGFLSARILDHLTEENMGLVDVMVIAKLLTSLPDTPFELVSVHDCFRCHPNHGNDLRLQYNTILADLNEAHGLLGAMASDVSQTHRKAKKLGTIPRERILEANYCLA